MARLLHLLLVSSTLGLAGACASDGSPTADAVDTVLPDAVLPDHGQPDAGRPDARASDLGKADAGAPARWEPVSGSAIPRGTGHSATLLADGRVLIAGGHRYDSSGSQQYLDLAFVFDPAGSSFSTAGKLTMGRSRHQATRLPDGRVLLTGGETEGAPSLASTEIFDPSKPLDAAWSAGPTMLDNRYDHVAIALDSGAVLIAGGVGLGHLASAELLTTGSVAFEPTGSMSVARTGATASWLASGKVVIIGGYNNDAYHDSLEAYDPGSGSFTLLPSKLKTARGLHTTTAVHVQGKEQKLLIVGGVCNGTNCVAPAELYDPSLDTLSSAAGISPLFAAATATLDSGHALVCGGRASLRAAWRFDPATGAWDALPEMAAGRYLHTATALADGSVLVAGGYTGEDTPAEGAERLYP